MSDVSDKILEKIRALLAKAAGNTTEEEAATCARLAQELLAKYNLTMDQVDASRKDDESAVGEERMDEMYGDPWRLSIVNAACRLYYCKIFTSRWYDKAAHERAVSKYETAKIEWYKREEWDRNLNFDKRPRMPLSKDFYRPSFVIVGREHNRVVCVHMIRYLIDTTVRLARDYVKLNGLNANRRLGFERGCGERLSDRVNLMAYEARKADEKQRKLNPDNLPMTIYDFLDKENEDYMSKLDLVNRKRRASSLDGADADAGDAAGKAVSLAPQIDAAKKSSAKSLGAMPKLLK